MRRMFQRFGQFIVYASSEFAKTTLARRKDDRLHDSSTQRVDLPFI